MNHVCVDDSQCNDVFGNPWHCRNGGCRLDYCTQNNDCDDAEGTVGEWFCVNYVCARAQGNSPFLPVYTDTYPTDGGVFQSIAQPNTSPFCGSGCVWPEEGAKNGQLAYPHVFGSRIPYEPRGTYGQLFQECTFVPNWDGDSCGFHMPAAGGTYILDITINIRVGLNQAGDFYSLMWFYMHIDRAGLPTPAWEMVDSDFVSLNNNILADLGQTYISMTTTIIASTATPGSPMTTPMAPGTPVYAGWSVYWPDCVVKTA